MDFFEIAILDGFVKSPKSPFSVIPAKAGIQVLRALTECLDPGDPVPAKAGNRGDDFLRSRQTSSFEIPWSPLAPPKAGKPCSTFDIRFA